MEYKIKIESAGCLECGDLIKYGRQDKKFCCEECKNRFNNRKVRVKRLAKRKVMAAIEKNYSILTNLIRSGVQSLSLAELAYLGYDLNYFTSFHKSKRHDEYGCYDIYFTVVSARVTSISRYIPRLASRHDEMQ